MTKVHACYLRTTCQIGILAFSAAVIVGVLACRSEQQSEGEMSQRDIQTVMDAHVDSLMAIDGVVGVAIGELADRTPYIMVLVVEETDMIKRRIPKSLEGHPVEIIAGGEIKPLKRD